jgi:hypothetical protein
MTIFRIVAESSMIINDFPISTLHSNPGYPVQHVRAPVVPGARHGTQSMFRHFRH